MSRAATAFQRLNGPLRGLWLIVAIGLQCQMKTVMRAAGPSFPVLGVYRMASTAGDFWQVGAGGSIGMPCASRPVRGRPGGFRHYFDRRLSLVAEPGVVISSTRPMRLTIPRVRYHQSLTFW